MSDYSFLANPTTYDVLSGIKAAQAGYNLGAAQRKQRFLQDGGTQSADGDFEAGRNALLKGGYFDDAGTLDKYRTEEKTATTADETAAARKKIGALAATGDYAGAASEAYRGGYLDVGKSFANTAESAKSAANPVSKTAGAFLKTGDYQGAANAYYDAGQNSQGDAYAAMAKEKKTKLTTAFVTALKAADTPEKFGILKTAATNYGYDPSDFQSFEIDRPRLLQAANRTIDTDAADAVPLARLNRNGKEFAATAINRERVNNAVTSFQQRFPDYTGVIDQGRAQQVADGKGSVELAVSPDGKSVVVVPSAYGKYDPKAVRDVSYAKGNASKLGQFDAATDQRKTIGDALSNHIKTAEDIVNGPGTDDAIGFIQSHGGYQNTLNLVNSGRVEAPTAFYNLRQMFSVIEREAENMYHLPGTGADTDHRNKSMREAFSTMLESPNKQVLLNRLGNVRAIARGLIETKRPSEIASDPALNAARIERGGNVAPLLNAPQNQGMISREDMDNAALPPILTPEQARAAPSGTRFRATDGRVMVRP